MGDPAHSSDAVDRLDDMLGDALLADFLSPDPEHSMEAHVDGDMSLDIDLGAISTSLLNDIENLDVIGDALMADLELPDCDADGMDYVASALLSESMSSPTVPAEPPAPAPEAPRRKSHGGYRHGEVGGKRKNQRDGRLFTPYVSVDI